VRPVEDVVPEGRSSLHVLSDQPRLAPDLDREVRLVPAAPGPENQLPEYPAAALERGCGEGAVAVRVYIGILGLVVRQEPVPGRMPVADECHALFQSSTSSTVGQWGFFPALRQTCARGECSLEPIESYVDLEFRFEVVARKPAIRK
jgi:hypothetical protein